MAVRTTDNALRDLYAAYAPSAFVRARGILGNDADAWDAVHEVFCKLAESNFNVEAQPRPMAYIYRATTNACLNLLESRRVRGVAVLEILSTEPGGEEPFHARDLLEKLDRHLDELDRQILILSFHDGLPQEQIAETLGVWRRTIGRRLTRLRALAEELSRAPWKKTP